MAGVVPEFDMGACTEDEEYELGKEEGTEGDAGLEWDVQGRGWGVELRDVMGDPSAWKV